MKPLVIWKTETGRYGKITVVKSEGRTADGFRLYDPAENPRWGTKREARELAKSLDADFEEW